MKESVVVEIFYCPRSGSVATALLPTTLFQVFCSAGRFAYADCGQKLTTPSARNFLEHFQQNPEKHTNLTGARRATVVVSGSRLTIYPEVDSGTGRLPKHRQTADGTGLTGKRAGELSAAELESMMVILAKPEDYKIPVWFLNRQKDFKDGKYSQLSSNALDTKLRDDLERLKKIRNHRGLRHYWGIRVRGQHTKTTGRRK